MEKPEGSPHSYEIGKTLFHMIPYKLCVCLGGMLLTADITRFREKIEIQKNLSPICEAVGSMETPNEALTDEIQSMRDLCAQYGLLDETQSQ